MSASEIDQFNSLSKEALNRFIYVIGAARGGTTIIRNAIGIHDNILMLPGMTHFMNQVWRYRKKVHNRLIRQIFRMPPFYGESEALKSLSEKSDFNKHIDRALKGHNLRHMWQIYPLVYGLDKKNTKRPDQILCWVDKANDFYGIETVRRYFPKGKFIFVVRDPRSAVLSLARRALRKEEHRIVAEVDEVKLIEACIHWRNMIQRMAYFSGRHPDRTIIVKFEDFLMTPEATLNRIFRFTVGVPMDHDVIEKRLRGLSYGASNEPQERGSGISRKPIGRWKEALTQSQVETIAMLTGKTAFKIGYRLDGSMSGADLVQVIKRVKSIKQRVIMAAKLAYLQAFEAII